MVQLALSQQWTLTSAPNTNWMAVASSADGLKIAAVAWNSSSLVGGPLLMSTDSGATWKSNIAPAATWRTLACSADGSKFVAGTFDGPIYVSTNSGMTWAATGPN